MKSITLVALSLALILAFLFVLLPAPAQAAADWYNADWAYRKQITIDHNNVPSTLTNFPVLINTTDADWRDAANGGHIAQPDGGDILFTASDGTTKLAHEIEKYTPTTGELVAWVQVPSLSAVSDTQIYIYYGNAGCADQWDVSGTWASDYKMVQHLEETSGTHYDSTQYGNDGIPHGGVIQGTAGRIDGADDFDGVDDYIACGNDTSLNIVEEITIEALVKGEGAGFNSTQRTDTYLWKSKPQLQVVGSKIYYVWAEWDGSDYQVWTGEMNNDGTNWTAAKRTEGAGYNKSGLQFQVVGTKTYYVWEQNNHQYDHQIWTGEMGSNILNKGDFYGIGIMGDTIRGFIDAGVDGFKYKGDAIDYTAGATVNCAIGSNWTHVAMTYDKSALNLYINGDLEDSSAFNRTINTNDFELVMGDDFDGMIDEVHVLDSAKSGDWKKTCADNELDPAIFYSVGSEETAPPPDAVAPVAAITDPPDGAVVQSQNTISGTITEDNSVASAELMIQRSSDSRYWNGSSWQPSQTWVLATVGGSAPSFTFSYDSSAIIGDDQYTVAARATDGAGNTGTSSSITYTIQTTAPVTAVPSVSVWGIIVMAALFAGLLVWMMESRQMAS